MNGWWLLLLVPGVAASPPLVAVVPDLPGAGSGDEGFAIGCKDACSLSGFVVTDGETTWPLPTGTTLPASGVAWFVGNESAWLRFDGPPIAGTYSGLQLGNERDELQLLDASGRVVDAFAWGKTRVAGMSGNVSYTSPGLVYTRDGGPGAWVDTDSYRDWVTPRAHRIGESQLDQPTWTVSRITAYASPDSSYNVLSSLLRDAKVRIHLHVYEFRSFELSDAVIGAKERNPSLDLRVLVDATPVAQSATEKHATAYVLSRIQAAGGQVVLATSGRYDDYHQKVLVVDDAVAVQSENWVSSGVPFNPSTGNRGWGVVLHSAQAANWFASWMGQDREAWTAQAFDLATYDPLYVQPGRAEPRTGVYGPIVAAKTMDGPFLVTPFISPEHTQDPRVDALATKVREAQKRVLVQQLDLAEGAKNSLGWSGPDPLLDALEDVAGRLDVRVQAAKPFSATDTGNANALARLDTAGASTDVMDRPGILTLHNKGAIIDDGVWVGSMNGNHHSRSANREAALWLEGPGVADYYGGLFDADWDGQTANRDWSVIERDLRQLPLPLWPTLLALVAVVCVRRWN